MAQWYTRAKTLYFTALILELSPTRTLATLARPAHVRPHHYILQYIIPYTQIAGVSGRSSGTHGFTHTERLLYHCTVYCGRVKNPRRCQAGLLFRLTVFSSKLPQWCQFPTHPPKAISKARPATLAICWP